MWEGFHIFIAGCKVGLGMVEKPHSVNKLCSSKKKLSPCSDVSGRIWPSRLGRTFIKRSILPGGLDRQRVVMAHQSEGAGGCEEVDRIHDEGWGHHHHEPRQSDCCRIHQPYGRNKVKKAMWSSPGAVECCFEEKWLDKSKLAPEGGKSASRYVIKGCNRYLGGCPVVRGGRDVVGQVVHSCTGHVHQCQVSPCGQVLQLVSRQQGCSERRLLHGGVAGQGVLLPPCPPDQHDLGEDHKRQGRESNSHPSTLANELVVVKADGDEGRGASGVGVPQEGSLLTSGEEASILEPSVSLPGDREVLTAEAQQLISADIRTGTKSIYKSRFQHFSTYCVELGFDPTSCSESVIVNFLAKLRKEHGYKYQTIAGYRSAISKFHVGFSGLPIGQAKNVKRLTKAVFIEEPPLAKYASIWPADKVLGYLSTQFPHDRLSDYQLGVKLLALVSLASISRSSTVALLGPDVQCVGENILFSIRGLEKTTRPGHVRSELVLPRDSSEPALDIFLCCQDYLTRTEEKRVYYAAGEGTRPDRLFLSNNKVRHAY